MKIIKNDNSIFRNSYEIKTDPYVFSCLDRDLPHEAKLAMEQITDVYSAQFCVDAIGQLIAWIGNAGTSSAVWYIFNVEENKWNEANPR